MTQPAYPAARAVAAEVAAHFAKHRAAALAHGKQDLAFPPAAEVIEAMIDAGFWASLRREEGFAPKISLAYLPPEQAAQSLMLERPLPLEPAVLTRVAPAVERPGIHLGVWDQGNGLQVWGATRGIPTLCFVLQVLQPGLLVVKHRRAEESGKFANVAVLQGDQIKVVDEKSAGLPDCPTLLTSLLGFDSPASWADSVNVLVQLALSMRAHGRGGSLLVVPRDSASWRESIVQPIPYAAVPSYSRLAELMREDGDTKNRNAWRETLRRTVDAVAGLTAVDGATLITDQYDLLAFGAKITRRRGSPQVEQVAVTEPVVGSTASILHPSQMGGTRHLSAAQFVYDQPDSVALVASQDGHFTVFAWSPCENMVHAHRVETLLL